MGYTIRGEVNSTTSKHRFDLVVFHNGHPLIIIEVKTKKAVLKQSNQIQKQCQEYAKYGVTLELISGMDNAKDFCKIFKYKYDRALEAHLYSKVEQYKDTDLDKAEKYTTELNELLNRLKLEVEEYHNKI